MKMENIKHQLNKEGSLHVFLEKITKAEFKKLVIEKQSSTEIEVSIQQLDMFKEKDIK